MSLELGAAEDFLLGLSDALRPLNDPAEIAREACRALRRRLGVDRVVYAEAASPDELVTTALDAVEGAGNGPGGYRISRFEAGVEAELRAGRVVARSNVAASPRPSDAEKAAPAAAGAWASAPLVKAGQLVAVLRAQHGAAKAWSTEGLALLADVAERTWGAVERARAEAALRAIEARQEFLLELSDRLSALSDPVAIEAAATRLLGEHLHADRVTLTEADGDFCVIRRDHAAGVPSLAGRYRIDALGERIGEVLRRGGFYVSSDVEADPALAEADRARYRALVIRAFVTFVLVEGGRWIVALSVQSATVREWSDGDRDLVRDMAKRAWSGIQRARVEEALREEEERKAFLLSLSDRLRLLQEPRAIMRAAAEMLSPYLRAAAVRFTAVGPDQDGALVIALLFGSDPSPAGEGRRLRLSEEAPVSAAILRSGREVFSSDLERDPRDFFASDPSALGMTAALATPLLRNGRLVAIVSSGRVGRDPWTAPERALHREVAERTWAAVERARAAAELLESEREQAFLLGLSDRLRALSDPRAVMRAAAEMLARQLSVACVRYWAFEADGEMADAVAFHGDGGMYDAFERSRIRLSEDAPGWAAACRAGHAVFAEDISAESRILSAGSRGAPGARASASIPFLKDGRLLAVLEITHPEPRAWTEGEKQTCADVTERTWTAVERARAEAALHESEAKYRSLFETMDEGFAICELVRDESGRAVDYRYVELNRAFEDLAGLQHVESKGRLRSEVQDGFASDSLAVYASVVEMGSPTRFEHYEPDLDRWYDLRVFPRGGDRLALLYDDITRRKRAEKALRESEARHAFLLELGDRLRSVDDSGAIQDTASRLLAEHLAASRCYYAECRQEDGVAVIGGEYVRGDAKSMQSLYAVADWASGIDLLRTGSPFVVGDWGAHALGFEARGRLAARGVRAQITVPLIRAGKLVATLTVGDASPRAWRPLDVSLVREVAERTWSAVEGAYAEEVLKRGFAAATAAQAEAERANKAKDDFLATLSHELRTPLSAILLWAGSLRSGNVPLAEFGRAIDAIAQSAEIQSRLVEDLLDLSRLASGKLLLRPSTVPIERAARAALDMVRPAAQAKGIVLEAAIADDLGAVSLDGARFQQVLWNLLSNATKFTPGGGKVTLRAQRQGGQLQIDVEDDGEGIAPEFLPHVFERFRQADMGETRRHAGLGVGLALARQLVELQGGVIEAHSDGLGRGAVFRVRLPWIDPAAAEAPDPALRAARRAS